MRKRRKRGLLFHPDKKKCTILERKVSVMKSYTKSEISNPTGYITLRLLPRNIGYPLQQRNESSGGTCCTHGCSASIYCNTCNCC